MLIFQTHNIRIIFKVGATIGEGLGRVDLWAVIWCMLVWIYIGWITALTRTGCFIGCLTGLIVYESR